MCVAAGVPAVDHGGSISAEHGIGQAKSQYLSMAKSKGPEIALMKQVCPLLPEVYTYGECVSGTCECELCV